jgi:hypothetical protein
VLADDMIEVVVNLNIIVNNAVLLIISIYISDLRVGLPAQPFIWGNLHRLSMILKIHKNDACVVLAGCVVGNTPFQFIPALKSIVHTI